MKKYFLFLMVLPIVACSPNSGGGTPAEKRLTLRKHYSGNSEETSVLNDYDVLQYDANGNLVVVLNYVCVPDNDDRLNNKIEHETKQEDNLTCKLSKLTNYKKTGEIDQYTFNTEKYDTKSMLVYKATEDMYPSGTYSYYDRFTYSYEFDSKDRLNVKYTYESRSFAPKQLYFKSVYSYDEEGRTIEEIKYSKNSEGEEYTEMSKFTYEYSDIDGGSIVKMCMYNYNNKWTLNYSEEKKYNSAGLEILYEKKNASNVVIDKTEHLYEGTKVTETSYDIYNNVLKKYSEDILIYDAPYTGDQKLLSRDSLLYDGRTKPTEGTSFQYKFDEEGRPEADIRIYFDIYSGERATTFYSETSYIYE